MLPDLARLSLGAPGAPTGMYRGPVTRSRRRARLAPAHADPVDEVLSDDNLVVEILNHIEDDDPVNACVVALKWANRISKAHGAKFDAKKVWTDLAERIFPEGNGFRVVEDPDNAQMNFKIICAKVDRYRTGEMRLHNHPLDTGKRPYVLAAMRFDPVGAYRISYRALQTDHEVALAAVRGSWKVMESLPESLLDDRDFALAVVSSPGLGQLIRYFDQKFLNDRDVVLAAVKNDSGHPPPDLPRTYGELSVLGKAKHEFRYDEELVMAAVRSNPATLVDIRGDVNRNKAAQLAAVRGDWQMLQWADQDWDVDIVAAALEQNLRALEYVDEIVLRNPEFKEIMLAHLVDTQWHRYYRYRKPRSQGLPVARLDRLPAEAADAVRAIRINLDEGTPYDPDESDDEWSLESFSPPRAVAGNV